MTPRERAEAVVAEIGINTPSIDIREMIERAIAGAILEEREACAQICDERASEEGDTPAAYDVPARDCATAIRNRSAKITTNLPLPR